MTSIEELAELRQQVQSLLDAHDELHGDYLAAVKEAEQLKQALVDDAIAKTMLVDMAIRNGGLDLQAEGGVCAAVAASFAEMLQSSSAPNYLEMTFESTSHQDIGKIVVTVQRCQGETPHQLRLKAEKERDELSAKYENCKQQAQMWKMEAAAHTAIVQDVYQLITGKTGEPGTRNGSKPVADALANIKAEAVLEACKAARAEANGGTEYVKPTFASGTFHGIMLVEHQANQIEGGE